MITPYRAALLCQAIYDAPNIIFDEIISNDDVYAGKQTIEGEIVITFRGTADFEDILLDIEAIEPMYVPLVGTVGKGFQSGVEDVFDRIGLSVGDTVIITGHSKGCANGLIFARYCLLRGINVSNMILFAPPRTGCQDFIDGLRNVDLIQAFVHGIDPVPHIPITTELFPVVQMPLKAISSPPAGLFGEFNPARWHDVALYVIGTSQQ